MAREGCLFIFCFLYGPFLVTGVGVQYEEYVSLAGLVDVVSHARKRACVANVDRFESEIVYTEPP